MANKNVESNRADVFWVIASAINKYCNYVVKVLQYHSCTQLNEKFSSLNQRTLRNVTGMKQIKKKLVNIDKPNSKYPSQRFAILFTQTNSIQCASKTVRVFDSKQENTSLV